MNIFPNRNEVVSRYLERFLHNFSKYLSRFFQHEENNATSSVGSFYASDNTTSSCKTVGQICLLQVAFYLSLTTTLWLLESMLGFPFKDVFGQLFSYQVWKATTAQGFLVPCAFLLNSVWMAGWLMVIVKRAKKCLDFSITMYLLHFVFCTGFHSFPYSWSWWLFMCFEVTSTTLLGEWLCMRRELKDIILVSSGGEEVANGTCLSQITIESGNSNLIPHDAYRKN